MVRAPVARRLCQTAHEVMEVDGRTRRVEIGRIRVGWRGLHNDAVRAWPNMMAALASALYDDRDSHT